MFKKSWLAGLDPATRQGMKKQTQRKPTRGKFSLLRQLCNLIPNHLVPQLAREHAVEEKSRTFRPWSHVVSLLYAQLTHALGLNDVCDALRLHSGPLSAIRGATPPSKNALSYANRERNPKWPCDPEAKSLELGSRLIRIARPGRSESRKLFRILPPHRQACQPVSSCKELT